MSIKSSLASLACIGGLLLFCGIGCVGDSPPDAAEKSRLVQTQELKEVHELFSAFYEVSPKPPKQLKDLAKFENAYPNGWAAVQSGRVVVAWGAKFHSDEVLAGVVESRLVLLADGTVRPGSEADWQTLKPGR